MARQLTRNVKKLMFNGKALFNFKNIATATSLKAWYAARLQPVVADSTQVTSPTDFSFNATTMTQATAANKPLYRTNVINGLPAFQFDGTNDLWASTTDIGRNKAGITTYCVYKRSSGIGATQTVYAVTNSAGPARHSLSINTGGSFDQQFVAARRATESAAVASWAMLDTQFHVSVNVTDYTNNVLSSWVDGLFKNSASIGGTSGANSENAGSATTMRIGSDSSTFLNGYIAEIIICEAAHTAGEVLDISTTLQKIYGGLPQ